MNVPAAIWIISAIVAGALGAILTAGETALMRTTRSMAQELVDGGRRNANLVTALVTHPGPATISARRVHTVTDAIVAASLTLASISLIDIWWLAALIAVTLITVFSLLLIGTGPRRVARRYPAQTLVILAPLFWRLDRISHTKWSQTSPTSTSESPLQPEMGFSEDELRDMVDRISELEAIEDTERAMIHSVFDLDDTVTREVMVPRTGMVTIDHDKSLRKAMTLFLRSGYSRIPVTRHSEDDIVGVLYFKDVVRRLHADPDAAEYLVERAYRPATFVPESKPVDDLLRMMQREATHVAIVVDEYGGTAGLVTIEDALEEIVGELIDEHDRAEREIEPLPDGSVRVPARLPLDDLGEFFDRRLEDDEVDSVGGLLAKLLGKVPLPGLHAEVHGLRLEAERTEGRRKQLSTVLVRELVPLTAGQSSSTDEEFSGNDEEPATINEEFDDSSGSPSNKEPS